MVTPLVRVRSGVQSSPAAPTPVGTSSVVKESLKLVPDKGFCASSVRVRPRSFSSKILTGAESDNHSSGKPIATRSSRRETEGSKRWNQSTSGAGSRFWNRKGIPKVLHPAGLALIDET